MSFSQYPQLYSFIHSVAVAVIVIAVTTTIHACNQSVKLTEANKEIEALTWELGHKDAQYQDYINELEALYKAECKAAPACKEFKRGTE